jgi:hypothetical protein
MIPFYLKSVIFSICFTSYLALSKGAKRKSTKGQTTISKHTYKTKDRVTQTALKTGGELGCSGRFSIS